MRTRATRGDESRTKVIAIRLTPAEHLRLQFRAASAGMTVSAFAAEAVCDGRVTVKLPQSPSVQPDIVAELKRIASNIHHFAAAANMGQTVPSHEVLRQVQDLLDVLIRDEIVAARINELRRPGGPKHDLPHL